jgi:hypothetical protein
MSSQLLAAVRARGFVAFPVYLKAVSASTYCVAWVARESETGGTVAIGKGMDGLELGMGDAGLRQDG